MYKFKVALNSSGRALSSHSKLKIAIEAMYNATQKYGKQYHVFKFNDQTEKYERV